MIQRIQSMFFLVAAAAFGSLFKIPFATSLEAREGIYQNLTLDLQDNNGLLGMAIAGIIMSLLAVFMFKNRKLQSTLGSIIIILGVGLSVFAYYVYNSVPVAAEGLTADLGFGVALPSFAAVLAGLANIFIKKDDKLVKSMDRLR